MAVAYRSRTVNSGLGTGTTVSRPTGTTDGDYLFMWCRINTNVNFDTPSGWTKLAGETSGAGINHAWAIFYKVASSEPASWSVTAGSSGYDTSIICVAISGASGIDVAGTIKYTSGSANFQANSITTTRPNTLVLYFASSTHGGFADAWASPSGYTEIAEAASAKPGCVVAYKSYASAGATGTITATHDYSSDGEALLVALFENTSPTITSGPTTTYASGVDTRPGSTWGVTFTPDDSEQTGVNALTYYIRTSATWGGGTQVATGSCTADSSKAVTGLAYNAPGLAEGTNTLYLHIYDGDLHTVTASSFTVLVATQKSASENAALNVTESPSVTIQDNKSASENAALNATESPALDITGYATPAESAALNVTESPAIAADTAASESAALNVTESPEITADTAASESAAVNVTEAVSVSVVGDFPPLRLRADVYTVAGTLVGGPIVNILGAEYGQALDQVGTFTFRVPAADTRAALLTQGREVRLYRESEGLVS